MNGELNAQIAKALGWTVWEYNGRWFMEEPSETPGRIDVGYVPDYIAILRDDVKMHVPRKSGLPTERCDQHEEETPETSSRQNQQHS
jgi:hypothetical protein